VISEGIRKLITLLESNSFKKDTTKAGVLPYFRNGDKVEFLFMKSSNPEFGGPDFAISKGHIDAGEHPAQAALREGAEELGLKWSNIIPRTSKVGWIGKITGLTSTYVMTIFTFQVKSKTDFNTPHYETGETKWMTAEEFSKIGRSNQKHIVEHIAAAI
jgi:8-oxo-dGTP pyrophosphatase MutT (NUDIX family)